MAPHGGTLVGREHELAALDGLLGEAAGGRGRAVVVSGEAGIGKTALVESLATGADEQGVRVAWGRCTETDAPAFWPWRQAMRAIHRDALTGNPATASRPELFARVVDDLAASDDPTLLILEDVHWADPASLALLRFITDAAPGLPLLVVATVRDDPAEAGPEVTELLTSLPPGVERLVLTGLDPDAVAELVAHELGHPPEGSEAARIAERCGGNPFFVREVARLQVARGPGATLTVPAGVRQVLERRLARLGEPCRDLLAVAAVAGDPDVDLIAEVVAEPRTNVLQGLDEATRAGLLTADGHGPRFAHALVRETIYALQPPNVAGELHRRVAELLDKRAAAGELRDAAAQLAVHWRHAAGEDARGIAAERALAAAREARERLGYEQAARFYAWALESPADDPLTVTIELGETQILAGDLTAGRATLRDAAYRARRQERPADLCRAVLGMGTGVGGFEVEIGDEEQVSLLEEALAGLRPQDDALRAAVLARLSVAAAFVRAEDDRVALAGEAIDLARAVGDARTEVAALAAWCDARSGPDHIDARLARSREMISAAQRAEDPISMLLARRSRIVALAECGDFAGMDAEVVAYARTADRLRLPLYAWYVPLWRGMRALMSGDVEAAQHSIATVGKLGAQAGSTNAVLMASGLRGEFLRQTSQSVELLEFSRFAAALAEVDPYLDAFLAEVLALAGEVDDARRHFQKCLPAAAVFPRDAEYLPNLRHLAGAAIQLDERDAAASAYELLQPYAHRWAIAGIGCGCECIVAHELGRLATYLERYDEADDWLGQALAAHREVGASLLVEHTKAALDELAAVRGRPTPAAQELPVDEGAFQRNGKIWQVRWQGAVATVPDSKGMRDLAVLLAATGREIAALDLVEAAGGPPAAAAAGGHAGERLDQTARTAYRRRLEELEEELAEAEANADAGRLDALRSEQQFLAAELAGALGLAGRVRTERDPAERARKAVTMRIRTAVKAIRQVHPHLAKHLDRSVTTGRLCAYAPERPVTWQL